MSEGPGTASGGRDPRDAGLPPDPKLTRPREVATASVLWMILGAFLLLGTRYAGFLALALGLGLLVSGLLMRWGSNSARVVTTVLGGITLIGIITAPLVVPALVLQFRERSNAWFDSMAGRPPSSPPPAPRVRGDES